MAVGLSRGSSRTYGFASNVWNTGLNNKPSERRNVTPEAKVKKKVRAVLDKLGCYYHMTVTGGFGKSGAPDFIVCYRGAFIGIECKAGNGKTTALQEKNLQQIGVAGGSAFVINEANLSSLEELIIVAGERKWL